MAITHGFIAREYVNLGEAPYKNVGKAVVTQARLAEPVRVLGQRDSWYEVEMSDTYRGFVSPVDVVPADKEAWESYQEAPQVLITAHFTFVYRDKEFVPAGKDATSLLQAATLGTQLPLLAENGENLCVRLPDGRMGYVKRSDGCVIPGFNHIPRGSAADIIALAQEFMGLPYFWGGTTPYGYDCSGFVQTILKQNGIHLLRDAHQQYGQGEAVGRENLEVSDLVFWSTYRAGASHVGFYMGEGEYIHAGSSKGVAINSFNPAAANYSEELDKKYLGARRVWGV